MLISIGTHQPPFQRTIGADKHDAAMVIVLQKLRGDGQAGRQVPPGSSTGKKIAMAFPHAQQYRERGLPGELCEGLAICEPGKLR